MSVQILPAAYVRSFAGVSTAQKHWDDATQTYVEAPRAAPMAGVCLLLDTEHGPVAVYMTAADYRRLLLDAATVEEEVARLASLTAAKEETPRPPSSFQPYKPSDN